MEDGLLDGHVFARNLTDMLEYCKYLLTHGRKGKLFRNLIHEKPVASDHRAELLNETFPVRDKRILELSCYHGLHTERLKSLGAEVTVLEARRENIEFTRKIVRAEFIQCDVRNIPLIDGIAWFDCIMCSGILYHVDEPLRLLSSLMRLSNRLFICTHVASRWSPSGPYVKIGNMSGKLYSEGTLSSSTDGIQRYSFWLTKKCLFDFLRANDFLVGELEHGTNSHAQTWTHFWTERNTKTELESSSSFRELSHGHAA